MKKAVLREYLKNRETHKSSFSDLMYKTLAKNAGDKLIKEMEVLSVMANDNLEKTIEVKRPAIDDEGNFDAGGVILHVKPKKRAKKGDK